MTSDVAVVQPHEILPHLLGAVSLVLDRSRGARGVEDVGEGSYLVTIRPPTVSIFPTRVVVAALPGEEPLTPEEVRRLLAYMLADVDYTLARVSDGPVRVDAYFGNMAVGHRVCPNIRNALLLASEMAATLRVFFRPA